MKWPFRLIKNDAPSPPSSINDKTLGDFTRVCDQTGILTNDPRIERIAEAISGNTEDIAALAKLLGQTDEPEF